jgi:hypothetical protein
MEPVKTVILSGWPALVQIMTADILQNFFVFLHTSHKYLVTNY